MVVAHPNHLTSSARWIGEAANNPKIAGVKIHPALGDYDVLGANVIRLLDECIVPSGLPVLSQTSNDSTNVTAEKYLQLAARYPQVRFIAAHLGVGVLLKSHVNSFVAAMPAHAASNPSRDRRSHRAGRKRCGCCTDQA